MEKTVIIDCFPESIQRYMSGCAVILIDVIRATTTAVTAVAAGRRCFPVASVDDALATAARLQRPLLVGEMGGNMPYGFDLTNSPAEIARRRDVNRPIVLLSSSGTQLVDNARGCDAAFLACFRNVHATAEYMIGRYDRVAVIGAGTRMEFREEDKICCAWIAQKLVQAGYLAQDPQTVRVIEEWGGVSAAACYVSKSVGYLRKTGQFSDLQFILKHVDDLPYVYMVVNGEILEIPVTHLEPEFIASHAKLSEM